MSEPKRRKSEWLSQDGINILLSGEWSETPESSEGSHTAHLYHWYLDKEVRDDGTECVRAHGIVTGHRALQNTTFIHTSGVKYVEMKEESGEVIIRTRNTKYHCMLSDCDFSKPGTYEQIEGLSKYAEIFGKEKEYRQEDNTILLVLSNHEHYYFEAVVVKENGVIHKGNMYPHIGTFQDSCLINCNGCRERIDIRYFPHEQHLEAYTWETGDLPMYVENTGDNVLYYTVNEGVIELNPGEQKLVSKENVMDKEDEPPLSRGDLYPAMFL